MNEYTKDRANTKKFELFKLTLLGTFFPLFFILLYIGGFPIKRGELVDSDCYMHLLRAEELYTRGCWYNPVLLRGNAPYGERLHWTRPFDIMLLLGAVPIALFTDLRTSLFWWGVVVSPVLMFGTFVALQWSTRPILGEKGSLSAGLIFLCQMATWLCYIAGRPDHQSLLVFSFVISVGLTLQMLLRPFRPRLCYLAGAISALSVWISVESGLAVGITLAVLTLFWVLEGGDFLSKTFRYSLALFVVTGISLALERPWYDLLTQEFDRLSIVHFSIFFLIALLWIGLSIFNRYTLLFRERINRFLSVLLCGAILVLTVFLFFPKFYRGPLADFDPRYLSIWFNTIYEVQPLLSKAAPLSMSIQLIGSVIISLAFLLYLLLWSARDDKRRGWLYIFFLIFVFTLLSFHQIRWTIYAQTAAVIPMAELMNRVLARQRRQGSEVLKTFKNVFIKLVFSGGLFLFAGALVKNIFTADVKSYHRAHIIPLCEYLNQTEEWRGGELCILTHIDFGAEILYRTKHKVIATLCNRYGQGTVDTFDIMMAGTDERALELLQKRKVDLILLWPESAEATYYVGTQQTSTFYQRLYKNMIPHWLRKVDLPPNLYSSFLLFRITQY